MSTEKLDILGTRSKATFGIDLGTTNSCISLVAQGNTPEIIKLSKGKVTMPSCVTWEGGDNFIVGESSYIQRYKDNTIYSVKRIMGTDETITLKHNGESRVFSPEEISSKILKQLCKEIEGEYGKVENVVITVPAYFNNNQVEATRKAGELAGLNVMSTFREPTSAALTYAVHTKNNKEERILVYDLGGGTFDVSLVVAKRYEKNITIDKIYGFDEEILEGEDSNGIVLDVIRKSGNMFLGGDDIDEALLKIMLVKLENQGISTKDLTKASKEYLKLKLEGFKKSGIGQYTSVNTLNFIDGKTLEDIEVPINIQDFVKATKEVYSKTKLLVDETLEGTEVDAIVLVGGSTKSELIKSFLAEDFPGIPINDTLNPDESVALGAALQAKRLMHGDNKIQVFDILPLSIGVLSNDRISRLLYKDQQLPYSVTQVFTTVEDNQEEISVDVYQGISVMPEECVLLGSLVMKDIPKGSVGEVAIYVTLTVNTDGVLKCKTTINNITKEIELVNILKGNKEITCESEDPRLKKKLIRWRRSIKGSPKEEYLSKLIERYEHGELEEKELLERLKEK